MEVILKEDVEKLGFKNDVVNVKNGYGRNFLIPQGLAMVATSSNKKMLAETLKQRAHKEDKLVEEAESTIEKLKGLKLKVSAKAGENEKIFGSVNNIQLAAAIKQAGGPELDRKNIQLKDDHIKKLGKYDATIRLYKNVEVTVDFEVVAEEEA